MRLEQYEQGLGRAGLEPRRASGVVELFAAAEGSASAGCASAALAGCASTLAGCASPMFAGGPAGASGAWKVPGWRFRRAVRSARFLSSRTLPLQGRRIRSATKPMGSDVMRRYSDCMVKAITPVQ